MAELLTHEKAWQRITALVKKRPTRCHVAVAYFGQGGSKLLPLGKGSTLVVDLSKRAVGAGQTSPSEVLKLVKRGVDGYSVSNLHAKVFVVGEHALVGSTNVSNSSANYLVEAVLQTEDAAIANACRRFVLSLRGDPVTVEQLRTLKRFWHGPSYGHGGRKGRKAKRVVPEHENLWVVPLELGTYDEQDEKAKDLSNKRARRRLRPHRGMHIDDFRLEGRSWIEPLKMNDLVLQVVNEGRGLCMVSRPRHILDIEPYKKGGAKVAMFSVGVRRKDRRKNLKRVLKSLPPSARVLRKKDRPRRIADPLLVNALMNLWQPARKAQ